MHMKILLISVRKASALVLACALVATLAACVDSADSEPAAPVVQANVPAMLLPTSNGATGSGHWWGTLSRDGQVVNGAMCLLVESGELACYLTTDDSRYFPSETNVVGAMHGTVTVSTGSQATGSGKIYATPGNAVADGTSSVADFTVTGGALTASNSQIELTISSLGVDSVFSGNFDHYYRTYGNAFLWPADGVYGTFDIYGDPASLSIDAAGPMFLQSASGCLGAGTMINIDPGHVRGTGGYNAYTVNLTVSDCTEFDGAYEGLATLLDFGWVNGTDNLLIAVFNDTNVIVGEAVK